MLSHIPVTACLHVAYVVAFPGMIELLSRFVCAFRKYSPPLRFGADVGSRQGSLITFSCVSLSPFLRPLPMVKYAGANFIPSFFYSLSDGSQRSRPSAGHDA